MTLPPVMLLVLAVAMAMMFAQMDGARVVSGQTVCLGGPERPCYKIAYFHDVTSRVAFSEALQACKMDGGSLLSIESHAEQKDIENLLQELRWGAVGGASGGGGGIADGDFWIGLTRGGGVDQTETGSSFMFCSQRYRWTDGSLATFRNWYFDEPSCGGEACVVMYHQPTAFHGLGGAYLYQWNDDRCNMKHNFICKYQPGTNSQSASPSLDTHGGRGTEATAGGGVVRAAGSEEVPPQVVMAGASGMLLVYVIIPTIPLLLLILVASGTCCFQMLSRSSPRTKTAVAAGARSTLWISRNPKPDSMDV
ncbi:chondrolectin [Sander vitreus]